MTTNNRHPGLGRIPGRGETNLSSFPFAFKKNYCWRLTQRKVQQHFSPISPSRPGAMDVWSRSHHQGQRGLWEEEVPGNVFWEEGAIMATFREKRREHWLLSGRRGSDGYFQAVCIHELYLDQREFPPTSGEPGSPYKDTPWPPLTALAHARPPSRRAARALRGQLT